MATWKQKFDDARYYPHTVVFFGVGLILVSVWGIIWPGPRIDSLTRAEGTLVRVSYPKQGLWKLVLEVPPRDDLDLTWSVGGSHPIAVGAISKGDLVEVWYHEVGKHNKLWQLASDGQMLWSYEQAIARKRWGDRGAALLGVAFIGCAFLLAQLWYLCFHHTRC